MALTSAGAVIVGAVVSVIVITWVAVDTLPVASVPLQVTAVVPIGKPLAGLSLGNGGIGINKIGNRRRTQINGGIGSG